MTRAERRRAEKEKASKPVYYQYTLAQIEEIKRKAIEDKKVELKEYVDNHINEEWQKREELFSGDSDEERMKKILAMFMSVPTKVLCEHFHWKPITDEDDLRQKLLKFSKLVVEETNRIFEDETLDIRQIEEEILEKYGVKYILK